jgi:lysophospholipase L1-like esterase
MARLKSIAAALVLLGASVGFALVAAETTLRLFPELMPEEAMLKVYWGHSDPPVLQADPDLGSVLPANHHARLERPGDDVAFTYTTDEHGFRNPSPWPPSADLVAIGDSMTFGYGVEDQQAWPALLAQQLPGRRVINLGLNGAGPQQYLKIYEKFGETLHPALVLLCLFPANDLSDAGTFDSWVKAGSPGNYLMWRQGNGNAGSQRGIRNVLEQSYVVTLLRYAVKKLRDSSLSARTIDFPDGSQLYLSPGFYAAMERQVKPDDPNFRTLLTAVNQIRDLAQRNGSQFLAVLMPSREEVYLPLLDGAASPTASPIAPFLDAAGISYLDLTPPLQAAARRHANLFFKVDGHPNAAGCRLIAQAVLDHLRSHAQALGVEEWFLGPRAAAVPAAN